MDLALVIRRGTRATQPAAAAVPIGTLYALTDEAGIVERSSGSAWESYSPVPATTGAKGIVELATDGENAANVVVQGNDARLSDARTPTAHATTHQSGGGDPIKLDDLAAPDDNTDLDASTTKHGLLKKLDNDTTHFLRGDGSWQVPPGTSSNLRSIAIVIDGGGAAITTGVKIDVSVPFACTITGVRLLADQSGSIVVDVWKDSYANYPPTVADTIVASAKPTISGATKSEDTTLTGWTTSINAGDTLRFNVDSCTSITRVTLTLQVTL